VRLAKRERKRERERERERERKREGEKYGACLVSEASDESALCTFGFEERINPNPD